MFPRLTVTIAAEIAVVLRLNNVRAVGRTNSRYVDEMCSRVVFPVVTKFKATK